MVNFCEVIGENTQEQNLHWTEIPDHLYRIIIVASSFLGKRNELLNLINHQPEIDKIDLYAKDSSESNYQQLINKLQDIGQKEFQDLEAFIKGLADNVRSLQEH